MDRLLRIDEAAEILKLSRAQIYRLLVRRQIESVRIGRARRIPLSSINEFIERLRSQGGADAHDAR